MPEPISPATRTFGERVRAQREAQGLSQEALAAKSGVHWTFLGQVERGRRNLSLHNLLKVAKIRPSWCKDSSRRMTNLRCSHACVA